MRVFAHIVFVFSLALLTSGCTSLQSYWYRDYSAPQLLPEDKTFPAKTPDAGKALSSNPSVSKNVDADKDNKKNVSKNVSQLKKVLTFKNDLYEESLIGSDCATKNICSEEERNAVAAGLMIVSDNLCNEHIKTIFGNDAAYNLGFGTATNLFAGAATVASSSGAKTLFSAIALFTNAERSLINETVYKTMLSTAITSKIRDSRKTLRSTLIEKLDTKDKKQYTFDRAVQDVIDYHNSCSFMNGLELALKEGTQNNPANKILTLNQNLKSLSSEYDSRKKQIQNNQKKTGQMAADATALESLYANDPQLTGIASRINSINESLKNLEKLELN